MPLFFFKLLMSFFWGSIASGPSNHNLPSLVFLMSESPQHTSFLLVIFLIHSYSAPSHSPSYFSLFYYAYFLSKPFPLHSTCFFRHTNSHFPITKWAEVCFFGDKHSFHAMDHMLPTNVLLAFVYLNIFPSVFSSLINFLPIYTNSSVYSSFPYSCVICNHLFHLPIKHIYSLWWFQINSSGYII